MTHSTDTNAAAILQSALENTTIHPLLGFGLTPANTVKLDLSRSNSEMAEVDLTNTAEFDRFIAKIQQPFQIGIGGYAEDRFMYKRSTMFENQGKDRSLHLGVDLWSPAGTTVYAPVPGIVHSFAFNDRFGDYGATIILKHEIDGCVFHTLYGHLSLDSLDNLKEGMAIVAGAELCRFGVPEENGHWPPHLHFQLIFDMEGKTGDYPGVADKNEAAHYLSNCPNPNIVLCTTVLN